MSPVRDKREFGLTEADRSAEILRKFGVAKKALVLSYLANVKNPTDQVLGAVIFLARSGHPEDVETNVGLANEFPARLLGAATVKDERG